MNKQSKYTAALLAGGVLMIGAWGAGAADKPAAKPAATPTQKPAATQPAPAAVTYKELPDTATAAEVNGVKIPMKDINTAIGALKQRDPRLADGSADANAELGKFQHDMLNDLVDFQLLLQEAKKRNITPDPKKVDAQIWQVRAKFPSEESYTKWLKEGGETEDSLRKTAVENMTVEELGSQLAVDVTVNDADLQKFYNDNKDSFVIPDSVLVSHILIAVKPDATDDEKKKLETKAQNVLKQALSSKGNFTELAAENSDDKATSAKGGNLGYLIQVDKGSWKPVVDAAFAGAPGKVVPNLVKSEFGYHIVKPMEKKAGRTLTLSEVRDEIKPMVLHQKVEVRIKQEIDKLRKSANIKTNI